MGNLIERVTKAIYTLRHSTPECQARAAIEAMREPTSEMVRYGETAGYGEIGHKLMQTEGRKFADAAYRAMIDVALRDK